MAGGETMKKKVGFRMRDQIFFVAFLLVFVSPAAWATIYYIDYASGSDSNTGTAPGTPFKHCPGDPAATDNAASTSLAAGDRVIFKGGVTYQNPGGIPLRYGGTGDSDAVRVIYDGDSGTYAPRWGSGTGRAIISGNNVASSIFNVVRGRSYITLNYLDMGNLTKAVNSYASIIEGADVSDANYIKVSNNLLHDAGNLGVLADGTWDPAGWGESKCIVFESSNWIIDNNSLSNCGRIGIYWASGASNNEIKYNLITDATSWGMGIANTSNFTMANNNIHHNTIYNVSKVYEQLPPHNNGIMMFTQIIATAKIDNTSIHHNYFYNDFTPNIVGGGTGSITFQANDNGNIISNSHIYNNVFVNLAPTAYLNLSVWGETARMDNIHIYNNSFYVNNNLMQGCISLSAGPVSGRIRMSGVYIKNNSCYASRMMIATPDYRNTWTGEEIDYNNWYSVELSDPFAINDSRKTWAHWQSAGYDLNGYGGKSNPLYTDVTHPPYNLKTQSGSPCIDHGIALPSPYNSDYSDVSRPKGAGWDIGAYERSGSGRKPLPPANINVLE